MTSTPDPITAITEARDEYRRDASDPAAFVAEERERYREMGGAAERDITSVQSLIMARCNSYFSFGKLPMPMPTYKTAEQIDRSLAEFRTTSQ